METRGGIARERKTSRTNSNNLLELVGGKGEQSESFQSLPGQKRSGVEGWLRNGRGIKPPVEEGEK